MEGLSFPLLLLDECSQMTEPASLLPMARYMQSQEGGKGREEGEREGVSVEGGREGGSVLGEGEREGVCWGRERGREGVKERGRERGRDCVGEGRVGVERGRERGKECVGAGREGGRKYG